MLPGRTTTRPPRPAPRGPQRHTVQQKMRGSDKPAFSLKFHDCTTPFYLEQHPNYTAEEKEAGIHERYLQNPGVKVLQLGKAS